MSKIYKKIKGKICNGVKITFPGGIHPPSLKSLTKTVKIINAAVPKQAVIPLSQHTGAVCQPVVSVGDMVKAGTLIGKSDKFVSSYVHSSISGKVIKIEPRPHPVLGICNSIIIESDNKDETTFINTRQPDVDKLTSQEIINIIREAGIAGLGGACFPTHVKLTPPKDKFIDTFILNGAECEPYLSCDHRVMLEEPEGVIKGTLLMMKSLGVKNGIIAIEDNKLDAIEKIKSIVDSLKSKDLSLQVMTLKTKYPQGAEKQIIKSVLNRIVPQGALPMDVGCAVQNAQTAFAVYEAVYFNKPLIERVITITGPCAKNHLNLRVRIGMLLTDLVNSFGGFIKAPKKVIFGGPMMGIAQYTIGVPVIKSTSGIILLSEKEADDIEEGVCIRCGKCLEICPIRLAPTTLAQLVKKGRFSEAKEAGIENCYECGACGYECAAKIPLLDYIKFGKAMA